jgi:hypothetical protein
MVDPLPFKARNPSLKRVLEDDCWPDHMMMWEKSWFAQLETQLFQQLSTPAKRVLLMLDLAARWD